MYKRKSYDLGDIREVMEYHNGRYGAPGMPRMKKKKATPEQIRKVNQWNKERQCWRKMKLNFQDNDYWVTLTYKPENRPEDMEKAAKDIRKWLNKVRTQYKKRGAELKWMRNIEVGTRGAWHIHIIVNRIPDTDVILAKAWKHGQIQNQLLYQKGEFEKLANYITKTPETDKRLREANYSASRNLPIPEPEKKVYKHWKTWGKVRVPKGWEVEKDSLHEGINDLTGYQYRSYTLIRTVRLPKQEKKKAKKKRERA